MRTFRSILSIHAGEKGLKHLPKLEIFSSTAQFRLSRELLAAKREKTRIKILYGTYIHI